MAAQKKKTGKKAAPPPQKQARPVRREVGGFVCLLLALCVLVSYFGVQAFFLTLLEKLLKGLTGYGYWLWAAALAVVGVVLVGHGGRPVCLRVTGTLAIPVLSGSLLHLLLCRVAYAPGAIGLPSLRDLWVDGLSLRGGGALSGGLAALLKAGFSSVVAGVLLLFAVPRGCRAWMALVGAAYALVIGLSVIAGAWHRPVDVVMSLLLAGGFALLAMAFTRTSGMDAPGKRASSPSVQIVGTVMITAGVLCCCYAAYIMWQIEPGLSLSASWASVGAHVSTFAMIAGVSSLVFGMLLAMRQITASPLSRAGLVGAPPAPPKKKR